MRWRLARFISSFMMRRFASKGRRDRGRLKAEQVRIKNHARHQVHYFHQLDDPYSHLTAQILPDFALRYNVELIPHLINPASGKILPEPQMARDYALKDAKRMAPYYGLEFQRDWIYPSQKMISHAAQLLTANHNSYIADISRALWQGDLANFSTDKDARHQDATHPDTARQDAARQDTALQDAARQELIKGTSLLHKLGHYSGAMFYYAGEWYWGLDRFHFLEHRLRSLGAENIHIEDGFVVNRQKEPKVLYASHHFELDYFLSMRSPYSYLSVPQVLEMEKTYPITINIRPVLPMVMRGMTIPFAKGKYIFQDAKREAERYDMDFGRVVDPIGKPVERGMSLFPFARDKGRGVQYLLGFLRASFGRGMDVYDLGYLRQVVDYAGLYWDEAKEHLDKDDWRKEAQANQKAMISSGCWGVPSFCLRARVGINEKPFACWGNDRLWMIKAELARRLEQTA